MKKILAIKSILLGLTISSWMASPLGVNAATQRVNNFSENTVEKEESDRTLLLSQRTCPSNQALVQHRFETQNYYIYICSGDGDNSLGYYVGINKNGKGNITLPLQRRQGNSFIARNSNVVYTITPAQLTVAQQGRILLNENVLVSESYDSQGNVANLPNYCREYESTFVTAETAGFWVNICGGDLPNTYVGVSKINGQRIRLPLSDYDSQGNYFEANNGNVSYLLIRGTNKGDFLTVIEGERELFRQPIRRWR